MELHTQQLPDPCSCQVCPAWRTIPFPPTACQEPLPGTAPTLTQRQDNQGEATQGHPSEGPCDGQHCVGHGGSAQHPKRHGAHQGQLEHGLASKPATSTGCVRAAGNLAQEQGSKRQTRDFRGRLKDAAPQRGGNGSGSSWCHGGAIPCRACPINIGTAVERAALLRTTNLALLASTTTTSSEASLKSHAAVTPCSLQWHCPSAMAYSGLGTATTLQETEP